jgi:hypothetical protein
MRISYANMVATLALIFAIGGTAFAASSPSSSGPAKLKLCAAKKSGDLRLLSTSGACKSSERGVTVDRTGLVGPAGAVGAAGERGSQGDRGLQGDRGPQGERGPAGPGTVLASPDGRFTVAATNNGIVLAGPKGSATFDGEELLSDADFKITAPQALTLTNGSALAITSGATTDLTTGTALSITSGAGTALTTGANFSQDVGGAFTQNVGAAYSQSLGGAATQNIANGFTQDVGGAYQQSVGGAYDQTIAGDLDQKVTKTAAQSVGGKFTQAAASITQKATTAFATTSGISAQLTAPTVTIAGSSCFKAVGYNQAIVLNNPSAPTC